MGEGDSEKRLGRGVCKDTHRIVRMRQIFFSVGLDAKTSRMQFPREIKINANLGNE